MKINNCAGCPCANGCAKNGISCNLMEELEKSSNEPEFKFLAMDWAALKIEPIPDWCPLRKNSITLELEIKE